MTSQSLNRACGVDVRAAMNAAEFSLRCDGGFNDAEIADDLKLAQAAVAELIDACKERDEADGKYGAAERMYGENSNEPEMREARGRIMRANKRYLAALAAVEGKV